MPKSTKEIISTASLIVSLLLICCTATYMFAIVEADLKHLHTDFTVMEEEHKNMELINEKYLNLNSRIIILEYIYGNSNISKLQSFFEQNGQNDKRSEPKICEKLPKKSLGKFEQ